VIREKFVRTNTNGHAAAASHVLTQGGKGRLDAARQGFPGPAAAFNYFLRRGQFLQAGVFLQHFLLT
jgi:hypothetical protein